jgi:hypothetical protein
MPVGALRMRRHMDFCRLTFPYTTVIEGVAQWKELFNLVAKLKDHDGHHPRSPFFISGISRQVPAEDGAALNDRHRVGASRFVPTTPPKSKSPTLPIIPTYRDSHTDQGLGEDSGR